LGLLYGKHIDGTWNNNNCFQSKQQIILSPRKDFARFKLALLPVGIIPRIFIAVNMSLITNPRTFQASTK
jgi:hypothetical protein